MQAPRLWHRTHRRQLLATVSDSTTRRGWFVGGAPSAQTQSPYAEFQTIEEAMAHADRASGCRQPCDCPPWQGPV